MERKVKKKMKGEKRAPLLSALQKKKGAFKKKIKKGGRRANKINALQKKKGAKKIFVFKKIGAKSKGERKKTLFKKKRKKKRAP